MTAIKGVTVEVIDQFSDPRWRLSNLYTCVDESGRKLPFIPNTAQLQFLEEMWFFNIILKSRQWGFTTLLTLIGLDQALFNDNWASGINAHTREDAEKIFDRKVRSVYDDLPLGLRTARPADSDSAKKLKFSNGSSIEVGTSLRSGTYQFVHVSEFGKICARYPEKAREIVTGTFNTVHPGNYLIIESTAEGREGYFYRYVVEAQKRDLEGRRPNQIQFKLHFFPWYKDRKNQTETHGVLIPDRLVKYFDKLETDLDIILSAEQRAWYVIKEEVLGEDMKREYPSTVEEAFEAAIEGAYLAKQMATIRAHGQIGLVPHDPDGVVNSSWDFGINDRMCIWLHQFVAAQHRLIGYITGTDDDVLYYWREMQKKPYIWGRHFLPHDATSRRIGTAENALKPPRTIEQILNDNGMSNTVIVSRVQDKYTAIQEARQFLPKCYIDAENCDDGIKCLDAFRKEWDEKAGEFKNRPRHDWAMHGYDAFETLARGIAQDGEQMRKTTGIPYTGDDEPGGWA